MIVIGKEEKSWPPPSLTFPNPPTVAHTRVHEKGLKTQSEDTKTCQFVVLMRLFMPLKLVYAGDIFGQWKKARP